MARANRAQDGPATWAHHSGRTRAGKDLRDPSIPSACWCSGRTTRSFETQGLLQEMNAIAATGFLVAFGNRNDQYHAWALEVANRVTVPLLTCDAVLAEAAFHLGNSTIVLAFIREGLVRPAFVIGEHIVRLAELATRYADRSPDLADLCLIRLSELHPRHPVITTDLTGFRVYRRGRREAIPLIHPPAR
jgi:uncharacterized protein